MRQFRKLQTATLLPEPVTGLWSRTGALDCGRTDHTATLLSNDDALIAGGNPAATAFTDRTKLYDRSARNYYNESFGLGL
jgi:hypothetical protein